MGKRTGEKGGGGIIMSLDMLKWTFCPTLFLRDKLRSKDLVSEWFWPPVPL